MAATATVSASFDDELIGWNSRLRQVWNAVQLVSRTDSTVLIQGETGTGKELIAKAIHTESLRHTGPA
jgi:transcriptional regulator with GAF, ATPase, and Fis domain